MSHNNNTTDHVLDFYVYVMTLVDSCPTNSFRLTGYKRTAEYMRRSGIPDDKLREKQNTKLERIMTLLHTQINQFVDPTAPYALDAASCVKYTDNKGNPVKTDKEYVESMGYTEELKKLASTIYDALLMLQIDVENEFDPIFNTYVKTSTKDIAEQMVTKKRGRTKSDRNFHVQAICNTVYQHIGDIQEDALVQSMRDTYGPDRVRTQYPIELKICTLQRPAATVCSRHGYQRSRCKCTNKQLVYNGTIDVFMRGNLDVYIENGGPVFEIKTRMSVGVPGIAGQKAVHQCLLYLMCNVAPVTNQMIIRTVFPNGHVEDEVVNRDDRTACRVLLLPYIQTFRKRGMKVLFDITRDILRPQHTMTAALTLPPPPLLPIVPIDIETF